MTQLATVTPQTIAKLRDALTSLNQVSLYGECMQYMVHEALNGGYDVVVNGTDIVYHAKYIKEVLGYITGMRDAFIEVHTMFYAHEVAKENDAMRKAMSAS
jgi:hypothetical protein